MTTIELRCTDRECIAPVVHTITEDGEQLAQFCERCFQERMKKLDELSRERTRLVLTGAHPEFISRRLRILSGT